jgi:hypothetical protein
MTTRCKFQCTSTTQHLGGQQSVEMCAVYSTDPNHENKKFWQYTPDGKFFIRYVNSDIKFEAGKEYYIDITLAE